MPTQLCHCYILQFLGSQRGKRGEGGISLDFSPFSAAKLGRFARGERGGITNFWMVQKGGGRRGGRAFFILACLGFLNSLNTELKEGRELGEMTPCAEIKHYFLPFRSWFKSWRFLSSRSILCLLFFVFVCVLMLLFRPVSFRRKEGRGRERGEPPFPPPPPPPLPSFLIYLKSRVAAKQTRRPPPKPPGEKGGGVGGGGDYDGMRDKKKNRFSQPGNEGK